MQQPNVSIMAVFEAIVKLGELTRANLAEVTGFSLMTVGKAIEKLSACGIVTEKKVGSGNVGRKTGVCTLTGSCGMILLDLTTDMPNARAVDIMNNTVGEYRTGEMCDLMAQCFCVLGDTGCGEIIGTACVLPDTDAVECTREASEILGGAPEVLVSSSRAWAFANSKRFTYSGMAIFCRVYADGTVNGAIMDGDRLYGGAHGNGGDISRLSATPGTLFELLTVMYTLLDPALIHIACEDESMCMQIESGIEKLFCDLKVSPDCAPCAVVEPMSICRSDMDGAALLLREKYVLSKIPNNT